jgi:hypothetical protein
MELSRLLDLGEMLEKLFRAVVGTASRAGRTVVLVASPKATTAAVAVA